MFYPFIRLAVIKAIIFAVFAVQPLRRLLISGFPFYIGEGGDKWAFSFLGEFAMFAAAIRKYSKTASMHLGEYFTEGFSFLPSYGLRLLRVIVLLSIWRTILAGKGQGSGMALSSVLTYTLISEVCSEILACRTSLPWELEDGRICVRYLRPMWVFGQIIAETSGRWIASLILFSIPLFIVSPLLGVDPMPSSPGHAFWFTVSLILAVSVGFAIEFIFSALVILLDYGSYSVNRMREAVTLLLSGAILPLAFMPWGLGYIVGWLPFASMASAPLRIYTGTGDPIHLAIIQAGWTFVLWPVAMMLWRSQRERLVSYGG